MKETKPTHGYRWLIRSAYCRRMRRGSRQKNGLLSCSVKSAHVSSMMRKSAPDGAAMRYEQRQKLIPIAPVVKMASL
jgi:hypothetical protein